MSTDTATKSTTKTATIYRMVMPEHTCPYGVKTLDLLERQGSTSMVAVAVERGAST